MKLQTLDKADSFVTASYRMVFYFKIHHIKSVLFTIGYCYSKQFEVYQDFMGWELSTTYLKTHVRKLIFTEVIHYIGVTFVKPRVRRKFVAEPWSNTNFFLLLLCLRCRLQKIYTDDADSILSRLIRLRLQTDDWLLSGIQNPVEHLLHSFLREQLATDSRLLIIFAKSFILDFRMDSEYVSGLTANNSQTC